MARVYQRSEIMGRSPTRLLECDYARGTLTDSVYAHVIAWQRSFAAEDVHVAAWTIHTKIGLSGKDLATAIGREVGKPLSEEQAVALDKRHGDILKELLPQPKPLPGATALLRLNVPYGIATSGGRPGLKEALRCLGLSNDVTAVCKSDVERAKPEPDLFLACQERLKVPARDCFVVGDAVWDMLAARRSDMLAVDVLTGGIGRAELTQAGGLTAFTEALRSSTPTGMNWASFPVEARSPHLITFTARRTRPQRLPCSD